MPKNTNFNLKEIEKELGKKVDLLKTFAENDFDSLDLISLIHYIEDKHKIRINEKKLNKIKSFNDLEKLFL